MRQLAFDSGPAALPRRTPSWGLLATVGLHLLLAASWRGTHPPAADTREERVFELLPLPLPAPVRAAPRAETAPARAAPARPARSAPAARMAPEAQAITVPADAPQPAADPAPMPPEPAPAAPPQETMAARARRDAVAIDRDLRKGKSSVPEEPDTRWARFVGGLEDAHKDSSRSVRTETYTAPDGQIIYRFRRGGRYYCRTSGFVRPRIGGAAEGGGQVLFDSAGGEGGAGQVRCPSQVSWKRD
jgi:hypothetical protein